MSPTGKQLLYQGKRNDQGIDCNAQTKLTTSQHHRHTIHANNSRDNMHKTNVMSTSSVNFLIVAKLKIPSGRRIFNALFKTSMLHLTCDTEQYRFGIFNTDL